MTKSHIAHARRRGAFTLIELLVVIAIIAILISLLLPSLKGARDAGRAIVCGTMLREMATAQIAYSDENKGYFAGPNTSGADGQVANGSIYLHDTSGGTPTTTHDWISPTLGDSAGLPANRAQRSFEIFDHYSCPSATNPSIPWDNPGNHALDRSEFDELLQQRVLHQISFISPRPFHILPSRQVANHHLYRGTLLQYDTHLTPFIEPLNYTSRVDLVGTQLSAKIIVADGTRFYPDDGIDFEINPNPSIDGGAFLETGPMFNASRTYGRETDSYPQNIELTFRHGGGAAINAAYFDTHVGIIKKEKIYADPTPWYPTGSVFTDGGAATPETRMHYTAGDKVP